MYTEQELAVRQAALNWWQGLNKEQKLDAIEIFKNSGDFRKDWEFIPIDRSSSAIQAVYEYIESVKG